MAHLVDGVHRRRPEERRSAGEKLVQDRPERIQVGLWADALYVATGLLRRHVARRAQKSTALGLAGVVRQSLGETEVCDLRLAVRRQQHVGRLQVAVNDAPIVGHGHCPGQQPDGLGGGARRLRAAGDPPGEAATLDEFQREEGEAVVLADLKDLHDVGVLELGHGFRLGMEAGQLLGPDVGARQHHLDGDQPVQPTVSGLVDDAHASPAEHAHHVVPRDAGQHPLRIVRPRTTWERLVRSRRIVVVERRSQLCGVAGRQIRRRLIHHLPLPPGWAPTQGVDRVTREINAQ
jgi:hypothetical protein